MLDIYHKSIRKSLNVKPRLGVARVMIIPVMLNKHGLLIGFGWIDEENGDKKDFFSFLKRVKNAWE